MADQANKTIVTTKDGVAVEIYCCPNCQTWQIPEDVLELAQLPVSYCHQCRFKFTAPNYRHAMECLRCRTYTGARFNEGRELGQAVGYCPVCGSRLTRVREQAVR